jgi:hypothetical protein
MEYGQQGQGQMVRLIHAHLRHFGAMTVSQRVAGWRDLTQLIEQLIRSRIRDELARVLLVFGQCQTNVASLQRNSLLWRDFGPISLRDKAASGAIKSTSHVLHGSK